MPSFILPSIVVANTRAPHDDTDYICAVTSVNGVVGTPKAVKIGEVNNGPFKPSKTYKVGFEFPKFESFTDRDKFVFSYMLINHGGDKTEKVIAACEKAMTNTIMKNFDAAAAAPVQGTMLPSCLQTTTFFGDDLKTLWTQVEGQFDGVHSDRCDGPVAMAHLSIQGSSITQVILLAGADGLIHMNHFGMDSRDGCGSNSHYGVAWALTPD